MGFRPILSRKKNKKASPSRGNPQQSLRRRLRLEALEPRNLLAVGPQLLAILPNEGPDLLEGGPRNIAPTELTFRFTEGQVIDPATLGAIHIVRTADGAFGNGNDIRIDPSNPDNPGFIGLGTHPNEVIVRFAETLPDDMYQVTIFGSGSSPLRNNVGDAFNGGNDFTMLFRLDLGARVVGVVPQPVKDPFTGAVIPSTERLRRIDVYFNRDPLDFAAAQNPNFYQLIYTKNSGAGAATDTASTLDDVRFLPRSVRYEWDKTNPTKHRAILLFDNALDQLPGAGTGIFRLRIGNDDALAVAPLAALTPPHDNDSSYATSHDLGPLTAASRIITAGIDPQPYQLAWPGGINEPGHRDIPAESHIWAFADSTQGITTIYYDFRNDYGVTPVGNPLFNAITETQKQRAREAFEFYGNLLGVQFIESEPGAGELSRGITVVTGDLRAVNPATTSGAGGFVATAGVPNQPQQGPRVLSRALAIMDSGDDWGVSEFGGSYFQWAMNTIGTLLGFGNATDLPDRTINSAFLPNIFGNTGEPVFPGDHDIVHGRHLFRPESNDIDLYKFQLAGAGTFSAETFAERLVHSSLLDTALTLFGNVYTLNVMPTAAPKVADGHRFVIDDGVNLPKLFEYDTGNGVSAGAARILVRPDHTAEQVAERTADVIRRHLGSHVSADLRFNRIELRGIRSIDLANAPSLRQSVALGVLARNDDYFSEDSFLKMLLPAGTYYVGVTSTGNTSYDPTIANSGIGGTTQGNYELRLDFDPVPGRSLVDRGGTRFDGDADGRPGGEFNFWFRVAGEANTIYVDKAATTSSGPLGSINNPYRNIADALRDPRLSDATPDVVRILPNGGTDGSLATTRDAQAYVIGYDQFGTPLSDGATLEVPRGVTLMIDPGTVFKMRASNIVAGSTAQGIDRSLGALQVLGIPGQNVLFTSIHDETIANDTTPGFPSFPSPGDWGGLVFRNDLDYAENRTVLETHGIFLNYVNQADLRYGGGEVVVDSVPLTFNPLHLIDARPTITYNTIAGSADAAISADPNSFRESRFLDNRPGTAFTSDYERAGPHVRGNILSGLLVGPAQPIENASNAAPITIQTTGPHGLRVGSRVRVRIEGVEGNSNANGDFFATVISSDAFVLEGSRGNGAYVPSQNDTWRLLTTLDNTINGLFVRIRTEAGRPLDVMEVVGRWDDHDVVHVLSEVLAIHGTPGGPREVPGTQLLGPSAETEGAQGNNTLATANNTTLNTTRLETFGRAQIQGTIGSSTDVDVYALYLDAGARVTINIDAWDLFTGLDSVLRVFDAAGNELAINNDGPAPGENPSSPTRDPYISFVAPKAGTYFIGVSGAGNTAYNPNTGTTPNPGSSTGVYSLNLTLYRNAARLDARLAIDPGVIVKLDGARIDARIGTQFIAEGRLGSEVVFTSLLDDRYGRAGTFDTNADRNFSAPQPGDWAGLFFDRLSHASLDYARVTFGGGGTSIEGGFDNFNAIEIHQADARITNSVLEQNANGLATGNRFDRGGNANATIFIRGAQPIIVNNIIRDNEGYALNINANALNWHHVVDVGRSTGVIGFFPQSNDNFGPLVRLNRMRNNEINGMVVRGATLTTQSIWDDTDIVHVLFDEIIVPNHHTYSGLRLQSAANQSLVVKLEGANAGFTANGTPLDIDDRIGGSLQIVGHPNFPVVLTSLSDDTVGAGLDPDGAPQNDTNETYRTPGRTTGQTDPIYEGGDIVRIEDPNAFTVPWTKWGSPVFGTGAVVTWAFMPAGVRDVNNIEGGWVNQALASFMPAGFDAEIRRAFAAWSAVANIQFVEVTDGGEAFGDPGRADIRIGGHVMDGAGGTLAHAFFPVGNPPAPFSGDMHFDVSEQWKIGFGGQGFDIFQVAAHEIGHAIGLGHTNVPNSLMNPFYTEAFAGPQLDDIAGAQFLYGLPVLANAGAWRSIRLEKYANDRNVEVVTERENSSTAGIDVNRAPSTAQFLGTLGTGEKASDETLRLGFEIHGFISLDHPDDMDVYSFNARAGTEVWFDIDRTTHSLDTIVELMDANGLVYARSNNSHDEALAADLDGFIDRLGNRLGVFNNLGRRMQRDAFNGADLYTTNPRDAGMRLVLPGAPGTLNTYFVRVRSDHGTSGRGETKGAYQLQVRLREQDEVPGSTVRGADIRFATNGIEVLGLPSNSPLMGDTAETTAANDTLANSQFIGNLLTSHRNSISVAGNLTSATDVDIYRFTVDYDLIGMATANDIHTWAAMFDIDYADGISRPDTTISVFDSDGNLLLIGRDSDIADDQPRPTRGADTPDLSRGTFGKLDPYIGTVQLPEGASRTYYVAVSSNRQLPTALNAYFQANAANPLVRLEPITSVNWLVEDHIGSTGGSTAVPAPGVFRASTTLGLNLYANQFMLSDVVTFVSSSLQLFTIDPFSGVGETTVTANNGANDQLPPTTQNLGYRDIAMRSDGRLFGFTIGVNDADSGNFVEINPADGTQLFRGDDGIQTVGVDNQGQFVASNQGVQFEALDFLEPGPLNRRLFAVGNIRASAFGGFRQNLLYELNPDTGVVLPDNFAIPNQPLVPPSEALPRATLDTGVSGVKLIVVPGSDLQLNDGDTFQINEGTGPVTLEMDSGVTIVVNQPGSAIPDGATFSVTDGTTTVVYSFDKNPNDTPPPNRVIVAINDQMSADQVAAAIASVLTTGPVTTTNPGQTVPNPLANALAARHLAIIGQPNRVWIEDLTPATPQHAANSNTPAVSIQGTAGVAAGAVRVIFTPFDSASIIAQRIEGAIVQSGRFATINPVATGNSVDLQVPSTSPPPVVTIPAGTPFTQQALAGGPGGLITGIEFIGGSLFAVTNTGLLLEYPLSAIAGPISSNPTVSPTFSINVANLGVPFTGLSRGPQSLDENRDGVPDYATTLFATAADGRMYAFDTRGNLLPIFADGLSSTFMGGGGPGNLGIAFSPIDYNLWHVTNRRENDPGHGINPSFDGSRPLGTPGGTSFYFGLEDPRQAVTISNQPGAGNFITNAGVYQSYDMPGGAHGALTTDTFSLKGYAPTDKPTLYFNYFLNTQDANDAVNRAMRDSFRVFISDDGANWEQVVTNNSVRSQLLGTELPEFPSASGGRYREDPLNQKVQEAFDNTGGWRQVRIDLGDFAGRENLRLRFDFSTAGSMDFGNPSTTGQILQGVPGAQLRDGDSFNVTAGFGTTTFEFDLGFTLVAPAGAGSAIADGETFILSDGVNPPVVFEFDKDGQFTSGNIAIVITNNNSAAQVATLVRQAVAQNFAPFIPGRGGITPHLNGPRVNLQGAVSVTRSSGARMLVEGDAPAAPSASPRRIFVHQGMTADEVAQRIAVAMELAFGGGAKILAVPGSQLFDGMIYELSDGTSTVRFEFDSNNSLTDPSHVAIPFSFADSATQIAINAASAINNSGLNLTASNSGRYLTLAGFDVQVFQNDTPLAFHFTSTKLTGSQLQLFAKTAAVTGFDQATGNTKAGPLPVRSILPGDRFGNFNSAERGRNNRFEGVYIDDIVIGFAERGEMTTGATPLSTFFAPPADPTPAGSEVLNGPYQLEIRRGAEYGAVTNLNTGRIALYQTFDTNDRLTTDFTLAVPEGKDISEGQQFSISDGVNRLTFEFDANASWTPGTTRVVFASTDTAAQLATRIRDLINNSILTTRAGVIPTGNRIDLSGAAFVSSGGALLVGGNLTDEPNDTLATAISSGLSSANPGSYVRSGRIGDNPLLLDVPSADVDMISFQLNAGDSVRIDIDARLRGSPLDSILRLFDASGNELLVSDDDPAPGEPFTFDSYLEFTATQTGIYYVAVSGYDNFLYNPILAGSGAGSGFSRGEYTIEIVVGNALGIDRFELRGDRNQFREQGQVVLQGNRITRFQNFGIVVDASSRDASGNLPHPASVRNTRELNTERLVPSVSIVNNLITHVGQGGILFSGDPNGNQPLAAVPFGRIVNNTVYGGPIDAANPARGVGISVTENASPTVLNNIVANLQTGVRFDATSRTSVLGGTLYKNAPTTSADTGARNSGLGDFPIVLSPSEPLFVDPAAGVFSLERGSKAIDSSVNSMQDRPAILTVTSPLGIAPSPVLAPDRDLTGQLRVDDPTQAPPPGMGSNIFKDRGALERVEIARVSIGNLRFDEGDTGKLPGVFAVQLDQASSNVVLVGFATANGSATGGVDYDNTSGTLTFQPGDTVKYISVPIIGDTIDEDDETFFVNLTDVTNALLLNSQALGTIIDNDLEPSISIDDVALVEGGNGVITPMVFTVRMSTVSGRAVMVNYASADVSATAGSDYRPVSGVLTFTPGQIAQRVTVDILGDVVPEGDETFTVTLSQPINVTLGTKAQGVGTIVDDEPKLVISSPSIVEGSAGQRPLVFTVTLSQPVSTTVTVDFNTSNGTAVAAADYVPASGRLTFLPGETMHTFAVNVIGDTLIEGNEFFVVTLSNAVGAGGNGLQGIGTIIDDDTLSVLVTTPDAGGGPHVRVFDPATGAEKFGFFAYSTGFRGGVRVAVGDVDGDGIDDIVTGTGPGGGPHVRVFSGRNGAQLPGPIGSFFAFEPTFSNGIYVAAGDVNGDGRADVIVSTDGSVGENARIRVFNGVDGSLVRSFSYDRSSSFFGGVRVAAADINGDGRAEVVAGSGPGSASRLLVLDVATGQTLRSYSPYGGFTGGMYVGGGDLDGDGRDEVITGTGRGGGPHVIAYSGASGAVMHSFFAYIPNFTGGVRVATVDANADGRADIVTAAGPGGGPHVRVFHGQNLADLGGFFAYAPQFGGGVFVGGSGVASPLTALGGRIDGSSVAVLTDEQLRPIVSEAIARWSAAGLDARLAERLRQTAVVISDLPGAYLGLARRNAIFIDLNAAGHGWFVDPTPARDEEFGPQPQPAANGRMDLLTTVMHELGHVLGLLDLEEAAVDDLMLESLGTGTRRAPTAEHVEAVFSGDDDWLF